MNNKLIAIAFSSIALFSCGGSDGEKDTNTSKQDLIENLSNTSWKKECVPLSTSSTDGSIISWYININISIDSSLKSTYKTAFFRPTDTLCESVVFDTLDISTFTLTDKIISEESIAAFGLNETFIYTSENGNSPPRYTLIYINSEKLYFGQNSGVNLGKTPETRHSSISLDEYFIQIIK
jgi:hypothetical protein